MRKNMRKSETVRVSQAGLIAAMNQYEALRAENASLKEALAKAEATIALLKKGAAAAEVKVAPKAVKTSRKASEKPTRKVSRKGKGRKAVRTARVSILMALPSGERICIAKRSFASQQNLASFLRKQGRGWTNRMAKKAGVAPGVPVTLRVMPNALPDSVVEQSFNVA